MRSEEGHLPCAIGCFPLGDNNKMDVYEWKKEKKYVYCQMKAHCVLGQTKEP